MKIDIYDLLLGKVISKFSEESNEDKESAFIQKCDILNEALSNLEFQSIKAKVDKRTKCIIVTLTLPYTEVETGEQWFSDLLNSVITSRIKVKDGDASFIEFSLVYDSIWN